MTNIWLRFEFGSEWKRLREIREPWQINKNKYQIKVMCRLHSGFTLRVSDTCQRSQVRIAFAQRLRRGSQPTAISRFSCIKTHSAYTRMVSIHPQVHFRRRRNHGKIRFGPVGEIWRARIPHSFALGGVHTRASLKLTPLGWRCFA
jgi:hypothetical protein